MRRERSPGCAVRAALMIGLIDRKMSEIVFVRYIAYVRVNDHRLTDFIFVPQANVRFENANQPKIIPSDVLHGHTQTHSFGGVERERRTYFLQTRVRLDGKDFDRLVLGFDANVERAVLQSLRFVLARDGQTRWDLQWIPLLDELIAGHRCQRDVHITDQIDVVPVDLLCLASFHFSVDLAAQFRTT